MQAAAQAAEQNQRLIHTHQRLSSYAGLTSPSLSPRECRRGSAPSSISWRCSQGRSGCRGTAHVVETPARSRPLKFSPSARECSSSRHWSACGTVGTVAAQQTCSGAGQGRPGCTPHSQAHKNLAHGAFGFKLPVAVDVLNIGVNLRLLCSLRVLLLAPPLARRPTG